MSLDRRQGGFAGALAALLVFVLLFAGCGGGDDGSGDGGSTATGAAGEAGGAVAVAKAEEFGSEASEAEAKSAEDALHGYLEARANGEWSRVCSNADKELRQVYTQLSKGDGCAAFVKKTTEKIPQEELAERAEVEVESVRVEGKSGYIVYTDAQGSQQSKPIAREGGEWKVGSLLAEAIQRASQK